jgi:hypothetical protein
VRCGEAIGFRNRCKIGRLEIRDAYFFAPKFFHFSEIIHSHIAIGTVDARAHSAHNRFRLVRQRSFRQPVKDGTAEQSGLHCVLIGCNIERVENLSG